MLKQSLRFSLTACRFEVGGSMDPWNKSNNMSFDQVPVELGGPNSGRCLDENQMEKGLDRRVL